MAIAHSAHRTILRIIVMIVFVAAPISYLYAESDEFAEGLVQLTEQSFTKKQNAIETIMASKHTKTRLVFNALLNSDLYYTRGDNTVVLVEKQDSGTLKATEIISDTVQEDINKSGLKKITINNKMRSYLKSALAELNLNNEDPALRQAAINEMINNISDQSKEVLEKRLLLEPDESIKSSLETALAILDLHSDDQDKRIEALENLKSSLRPEVKQAIIKLIQNEEDPKIKAGAQKTLASIDSKIAFFRFIETVFFGLSMGSVLVLASIGLAITFGVIGVINMAHGELIMIGAYTTFVIQQLLPNSLNFSLFVAIPAAFLVSGLVGIVIEKGIIRFLYGRPLETLLATFGVSLVLQQAVRSIFSPLNRTVETPVWMRGSLAINDVLSLTINRLSIFIFCFIVFAALNFIMKKTSIGLQVRAISQNRIMARAMGVKAAKVDALTFGLGSGIAGIAGVALSQLTNVGPNLGQAYIVDSFMVVVFGGVGNLWGTMVGGLTLGIANKFLEPWSGAVLAKIFILVFIILFIQKRPQGMFPQKGRAAGGN